MILEAQPDIEVVGEAANGLDAVALARSQGPDVVLMDVRMPELDGIEATRRVMSAPEHNVRVLMLTTFDLDEYVYRAGRVMWSAPLQKICPLQKILSAGRTGEDARSAICSGFYAPEEQRCLQQGAARGSYSIAWHAPSASR
jgi:DNA-binding NarL/FixJ family response regulator